MRTLIFGTCYAPTPEKHREAQRWMETHREINPNSDLLLLDCASLPLPITTLTHRERVLSFSDNIGHLARGGKDGWGRAWCYGLTYAITGGYDYVAHIEGDSLLRLPVEAVFIAMKSNGFGCASVPVGGTKRPETDWVETGLMFFDVTWMARANVTGRYDWISCNEKRTYPRLPEWHVHEIVKSNLWMMQLKAERGDRGQITLDNVAEYDWITHVPQEVMSKFQHIALTKEAA